KAEQQNTEFNDSAEQDEKISQLASKKSLPPLLLKLSERKAEGLDYMGVAFGVTQELFKFWKKNNYYPVYVRQTANELTGEHSCISLKLLSHDQEGEGQETSRWLSEFSTDFQRRFASLLAFQLRSLPSSLA